MEPSKQYTFLNDQYGFSISYIDGLKLMNELKKIHNIGPHAIKFYQKSVLSSIQMINFLKSGENLGFYIDSDSPYYRFKIEINQNGSLRTLLLPEELDDFPLILTGKVRIVKISKGRDPYTSILEFKGHNLEHIVNEVMEQSYQTNSKIYVSEHGHNSLMISKLPPSNVNKKIDDFEDLDITSIEQNFQSLINEALNFTKPQSVESLLKTFEKSGLKYLASKEVRFHCPCSKERMIENIFTLPLKDRQDIFDDNDKIDTRCDYCNTIYTIDKDEILIDLH